MKNGFLRTVAAIGLVCICGVATVAFGRFCVIGDKLLQLSQSHLVLYIMAVIGFTMGASILAGVIVGLYVIMLRYIEENFMK